MQLDVPVGSPSVARAAFPTPTLPPAATTNSYAIAGREGFYVVEPAPSSGRAQRAMFDWVRQASIRFGRLLGAVVTHHHRDHVGAAAAFTREFGVPLVAHTVTGDLLPEGVRIDTCIAEGDTLLDGSVRVLHTPGHAPGHLCLLHAGEGWLVAGDMVASVGTIVVDPDDGGDMGEYLAQLRRLRALGARQLLPAHGEPIDRPDELLDHYVAHRLEREEKIFRAVEQGQSGATLGDVVRWAYADTPAWLWPLASRSALAHLDSLVRQGRAQRFGDHWSLAR